MNWLLIGFNDFENRLREKLIDQGDTVELLVPDQKGEAITSKQHWLDWIQDHGLDLQDLENTQVVVDLDGLDLGFVLAAELALQENAANGVVYLTTEDDREQIFTMISGGDVLNKREVTLDDFIRTYRIP